MTAIRYCKEITKSEFRDIERLNEIIRDDKRYELQQSLVWERIYHDPDGYTLSVPYIVSLNGKYYVVDSETKSRVDAIQREIDTALKHKEVYIN